MQNEEFLRELKRNEDFMRTLEFERDMLAKRLLHEQKKNRQLSQLSPSASLASSDRPPNWMVPRPSECDDTSLATLSSTSSDGGGAGSAAGPTAAAVTGGDGNSNYSAEPLSPSLVPVDRTDKTDVHDFRDQLKSMGASSKKKFALLAKKFFSTSRKKRKGGARILRDAHGPSTLNLLDDNDDEDLIDATAAGLGGSEEVLFEPLPDAWTSDETNDASRPSGTLSEDNREHFL